MAVTTTTQITPAQTEFFNKVLLLRAKPYLSFDKIGLLRPLPLNTSNQVRFRRFGALAVTTTDLAQPTTESPDRAAVQLSITDVTGTIIKRGNGIALTDIAEDTSAENVVLEATDVNGQNAGESVDIYYRNAVDAGTTVVYSNGTTRAGLSTVLDSDDINRTVRTLEIANARKVTKIINASTGVGTTPIRPAFIAVCHPRIAFTLRQLTGWVHASAYANQVGIEGLMDGEIGELNGIRFVMSTQSRIRPDAGAAGAGVVSTGGVVADVFETLVFGEDAYGRCPLSGKGLVTIFKPLGSGGAADFLDEISTVAWKFRGVAVILNEDYLVRAESAGAS